MIEYVCRWCGESFRADHDQPAEEKASSHRYCGSALAVMEYGTSLEEVLDTAVRFEEQRPIVAP